MAEGSIPFLAEGSIIAIPFWLKALLAEGSG